MKNEVFNIQSIEEFNSTALKVFKYQFDNNAVYRSFCDLLYIHPADVKKVEEIPFLPIQFFKSHEVISSSEKIKETFSSSGTTGSITSKHFVTDTEWYTRSYLQCFNSFYGDISSYTVLALLPNYLERKGSSLTYMVNDLIIKIKTTI